MIDVTKHKPGIYWNGKNLDYGFWLLQPSGKLYYSGTPVDGSVWSLAQPQNVDKLYLLCGLDGDKAALSALIDEVIGEDEDRNHRYNTNWRVEVDAQNYLRQQQRQRKRELMGEKEQ